MSDPGSTSPLKRLRAALSGPIASNLATLAGFVALLAAVSFLPPDTSLREVERAGLMRACVPPDYPPLITTDPDAPGFEVEVLREAADRMGVRLALNTNSAIGRDLNPRNWRVTRAQCQVIAGGVAATRVTRSYLETTPPHLENGWAAVLPEGGDITVRGAVAGVFPGVSGFDRIALARFLNAQGIEPSLIANRDAFVSALEQGEVDFGITNALIARQIARQGDWRVMWLSDSLARFPVAFGLWKGDLTFKRALVGVLEQMERDGVYDRLRQKYFESPIEGTLIPAPPEANAGGEDAASA